MDVYLRNFWSLYLEFVEAFKELEFENIPIPLCYVFYELLDDQAIEWMSNPSFSKTLSRRIRKPQDIQPAFNPYLRTLNQATGKHTPSPDGKIILYDGELRMSPDKLLSVFNPAQLLWFRRADPANSFGTYAHHGIDLSLIHQRFVQRSQLLFDYYADHPIFGQPFFQARFTERIATILDTITSAKKLIQTEAVSCIIVGTIEYIDSRSLALIGLTYGIPSICTQHGLIGMEEGYMPIITTKYAVYGNYEKEWFRHRGADPDQIAVTGHPQFDPIFTDLPIGSVHFRDKYNLDYLTPILFIASSPFLDYSTLYRLISAINQQLPMYVMIKPHPSEMIHHQIHRYDRLKSEFDNVIIIYPANHSHLTDILPSVEAILVDYSTVGLMGILYHKPVFVLQIKYYVSGEDYRSASDYQKRLADQMNRHYDYFDSLQFLTHSDPEHIAETIKKYCHDDDHMDAKTNKRVHQFASQYPTKLSIDAIKQCVETCIGAKLLYKAETMYAQGQLVKGTGPHVYMLNEQLERQHIPTEEQFYALGLQWEDVYEVDDRILDNLPQAKAIHPPDILHLIHDYIEYNRSSASGNNGRLVKGSSHDIFIIHKGRKRHIRNQDVFNRLQFHWHLVRSIPDDTLHHIPNGLSIASVHQLWIERAYHLSDYKRKLFPDNCYMQDAYYIYRYRKGRKQAIHLENHQLSNTDPVYHASYELLMKIPSDAAKL